MLRASSALALAVGIALPDLAAAQSPFAGTWSLRYESNQPACARPSTWRYPLLIDAQGKVSPAPSAGDSATAIVGRVEGGGAVSAVVQRGQDRAIGTGKLDGRFGSGSWNSPSRNCSGTWTATRTQ